MWLSLRKSAYAICPPVVRPVWQRVQASEIGSRMARGAFWSFTGAALSRGSMLVAVVCVARMLGATGYGELTLVRSTVGMLGMIAGFRLGLTATKYVAEYRRTEPERAGRVIVLSNVVALATAGLLTSLLMIFAPWMASEVLRAPQLASVLRWGALMMLSESLVGAQNGALAGFEAFRTIARVNAWVALVSFPLMVGGTWLAGLEGAITGWILSLTIHMLLNQHALRVQAREHGVPLKLRGCLAEWDVLWRFSLPAALSGMLVGPVNWVCATMLARQPNGLAELGIFNAANQWRIAILFVPIAVGNIALPILANLQGEKHATKYRKVLRYNMLLNALLATAIAVPVACVATFIMSMYGSSFAGGGTTLALLALTSIFMSVTSLIGQAIASQGRMWYSLLLNFSWTVLLLTATSVALHFGYGAQGLAAANAIAYLLYTAYLLRYALRILIAADEQQEPHATDPQPAQ